MKMKDLSVAKATTDSGMNHDCVQVEVIKMLLLPLLLLKYPKIYKTLLQQHHLAAERFSPLLALTH